MISGPFRIGLIAGLQLLSGCASGERERDGAIAEVEARCGLPAGILSEIHKARRGALAKSAPSDLRKDDKHKRIYFGTLMTGMIVEKRSCITSFRSSNGYRFHFHVKTPF